MTQEEKQLVFRDLCSRVLYGVKVDYHNSIFTLGYNLCLILENIESVKPYLRPMSSMTEEEKKDYNSKFEGRDFSWEIYYGSTDWLNEHHFDYRGLIPMGLALPAPEGMYK